MTWVADPSSARSPLTSDATSVFDEIPLVDNHAHPWLRVADEPFSRYFTEGPVARPDTLFYRQAVRELAGFLGCAADEASVVAARAEPNFARRLATDARLTTLLVDDGYPREGGVSVADMADSTGVLVRRVVRLERLAEDLILEHRDLARFTQALVMLWTRLARAWRLSKALSPTAAASTSSSPTPAPPPWPCATYHLAG